jgi:hypothetical protein
MTLSVPKKLSMKFLSVIFPVVLLAAYGKAQPSEKSRFIVININDGKDDQTLFRTIKNLNMEISREYRRENAFNLITQRLKKYKNIHLKVRERISGSVINYYDFINGNPQTGKISTVDIKGTKSAPDETIYYVSQFEKWADTLLIMDTVTIKILPKDFSCPIGSYFVSIDSIQKPVPSNGKDILYFYPSFFSDLHSSDNKFTLHNRIDPAYRIITFPIHILTPYEKNMLMEIGRLLLEENSSTNDFKMIDVANHVQQYARQNFGYVTINDLIQLLHKSGIK